MSTATKRMQPSQNNVSTRFAANGRLSSQRRKTDSAIPPNMRRSLPHWQAGDCLIRLEG